MEFDVDQEDNFGKAGRVARKKREVKEKERKHLSGNAAKELYLECIQLILRKQLAWLVRERSLPLELEVVVRDLWDLRVRNFGGLKSVEEKRKGKNVKSEPQSSSDGELAFFSSQSEAEPSSEDNAATPRSSRFKSWTADEGGVWAMPSLLDTLALNYLGCLTIRQPVRIGDLHRWAKRNKLPYRGAVRRACGQICSHRGLTSGADQRNPERDARPIARIIPQGSPGEICCFQGRQAAAGCYGPCYIL